MKQRSLSVWIVLSCLSLALASPAQATFGGFPWETPLQVILGALTGTTGTLLATLAVAVVGVLALAGRWSWSYAGSVAFGIACLFGCARIVAILNG